MSVLDGHKVRSRSGGGASTRASSSYVVRLVAFGCLIVGILDKNRRSRQR